MPRKSALVLAIERWGPDDPSIKVGGHGAHSGPPPPGSVYQCHAKKRGTNPPQRCKRWALKGSHLCQFHGGTRTKARRKPEMASYYTSRSRTSLKDALEQLRDQPPDERHSLQDEIDLAREMAVKAMRLYEEAWHGEKAADYSNDLKLATKDQLQKALDFVGSLIDKSAKVRNTNRAVVDYEQIDWFIAQITRAVEEEILPENPILAERFVKRLEQIKVPERRDKAAAQTEVEELARLLRAGSEAIMQGISAEPEE